MPAPRPKDVVAQWAFDTRPLLLRFHLWLEGVDVSWLRGGGPALQFDFLPAEIGRCLAMTAGVTALGTKLFAPFGRGCGADKQSLNQVKKESDAISAYVMSEALWHFTRKLPENHAIMVSLGEGLMPKGGETPEMGANPLLGFGRVYARPAVAQFVDARVNRLINEPGYGWRHFYTRMRQQGITLWGAAVDTLENTSRFAKGEALGPLSILHLFDQPLTVARPYEAYMGSLAIPGEVTRTAEEHSIHLDLLTPRRKVVEAIELTVPGIRRENIHVWTLGGKAREPRLGQLWAEWREIGVHLVEHGWTTPAGLASFTDSGTYAPTYLVGRWQGADGAPHVFLCDGYAASAEAVQAATLSEALDVDVTLSIYSPRFDLPMPREQRLMRLGADDPELGARLRELFAPEVVGDNLVEYYRSCLREMAEANMPRGRRVLRAADFFPEKEWKVVAALGYMGQDPYTGLPGVEQLAEDTYRVTTQVSTRGEGMRIAFTFRLLEPPAQSRLVFSPLLERFVAGEDYRHRAVKVSDSGRIRNELLTLCSQALEHVDHRIVVHFGRIDDLVIPPAKKRVIREVLEWYKANHPVWFSWLEVA